MNYTMHYDSSVDADFLKKEKVAVIGYGVQGRAFSLNLRDSGIDVQVGNIEDAYFEQAKKDGFAPCAPAEAVKDADVILLLIPDEAHKAVYENAIVPNHKTGATLLLAHGYSFIKKDLRYVEGLDLGMAAPRLYGALVRSQFKQGHGVPAFYDVIWDCSKRAETRALAVCKLAGFTRAGVMRVSYREEALLDLFQEQFLAPALVDAIQMSFEVLVERGYNPIAVIMEMYASAEMGHMLVDGAKIGLDATIDVHGSPTCQAGYYRNRGKLNTPAMRSWAHDVLTELESGNFGQWLEQEASKGYPLVKAASEEQKSSHMQKTHEYMRSVFRWSSRN